MGGVSPRSSSSSPPTVFKPAGQPAVLCWPVVPGPRSAQMAALAAVAKKVWSVRRLLVLLLTPLVLLPVDFSLPPKVTALFASVNIVHPAGRMSYPKDPLLPSFRGGRSLKSQSRQISVDCLRTSCFLFPLVAENTLGMGHTTLNTPLLSENASASPPSPSWPLEPEYQLAFWVFSLLQE